MRPVIKPALRRLWRDQTTLQIGLDPERAVVLGGVDHGVARLVETLDGTRETSETLASAAALGVDPPTATRLLDLLTGAGVLDDAAADTGLLYELDAAERDRLRPDLASLSLVHRAADGGVAALARRRAAVVHVHGAGRVGAVLASLLSAAGVGCVAVRDAAPVRPADTAPGGLSVEDVGARRQDAAGWARRRVTREPPHEPPAARRPDLVVLTPAYVPDPRLTDRLMRSGVPHLFAAVRETTGVAGPLVLPSRSSCLRCHDLYRRDRDPAWPRIAAQLSSTGPGTVVACDTVLAVTVAAHAALQALTFLAGDRPTTVDGTLEITLPEGRVRRRSWSVHPACGCGWAREPAGAEAVAT